MTRVQRILWNYLMSLVVAAILMCLPQTSEAQITGGPTSPGGIPVPSSGLFADRPTSPVVGQLYIITDAPQPDPARTPCTIGGGDLSAAEVCVWNGEAWIPAGIDTTSTVIPSTDTLADVCARGCNLPATPCSAPRIEGDPASVHYAYCVAGGIPLKIVVDGAGGKVNVKELIQ